MARRGLANGCPRAIRHGTGDNPRIGTPAPQDPPPRPPGTGPGRWLERAGEWIVPRENPAGVVYGMIVIGALLAAESGLHETYLDTVGSALIATALYWLAHAYASVLGRRLTEQDRLTAGALWRALAHDWALVRGATIPLLVLLLAWVTGAAQATAVTAALWSAVAGLIAFELLAAVRSRAGRSSIGPAELALEVGVGAAMGVAILALKVVLH